MSEAIAAVVFDLDGVLVDSESVWDAARREVVARNGGRWQADATRTMMGMSSPEWSRYLHDQLGVPLEPERINELVVAAVLEQYRRRLPLLPGAVAGGQTARGPLAAWAGIIVEPACDRRRARASGNHRLFRYHRLR
jgi:beta-phosphoglucomutase-like phosphatase (HAD superfamily)